MAENPIQLTIPECAPRAGSAILARFGRMGLRLLGWKVKGEFLNTNKLIVVVAPHRSNWDWIVGVCGLWALRLKFSYLIKDAVMVWPLSLLIRRTGGIPIDRSSPEGVLDQVTQAFQTSEKLYFAITPEGTRKEVSRWKTGFLRIAYAAEVPVVPMIIDYQNKEFRFKEPFEFDEDVEADLEKVQGFYAAYTSTDP